MFHERSMSVPCLGLNASTCPISTGVSTLLFTGTLRLIHLPYPFLELMKGIAVHIAPSQTIVVVPNVKKNRGIQGCFAEQNVERKLRDLSLAIWKDRKHQEL